MKSVKANCYTQLFMYHHCINVVQLIAGQPVNSIMVTIWQQALDQHNGIYNCVSP